MHWQVQEAKQRLSEVLRAAESEPQIITRHGEEIAVIVDIDEYRQMCRSRGLLDYLRSSPPIDDLDLERSRELPRDIDLGG